MKKKNKQKKLKFFQFLIGYFSYKVFYKVKNTKLKNNMINYVAQIFLWFCRNCCVISLHIHARASNALWDLVICKQYSLRCVFTWMYLHDAAREKNRGKGAERRERERESKQTFYKSGQIARFRRVFGQATGQRIRWGCSLWTLTAPSLYLLVDLYIHAPDDFQIDLNAHVQQAMYHETAFDCISRTSLLEQPGCTWYKINKSYINYTNVQRY